MSKGEEKKKSRGKGCCRDRKGGGEVPETSALRRPGGTQSEMRGAQEGEKSKANKQCNRAMGKGPLRRDKTLTSKKTTPQWT